MGDIHDTNSQFEFDKISLTTPTTISGGVHFSKILINKKQLYIQSPKCKTKQGIVKSGKKSHADLVFTNDDEEFIQWLETLETTVRKLIYDNRTKWFDTDLTEEDVESYFTPTVKLFKSGKMYLVRVNASLPKGNQSGSIVLKKSDGIDTMVKIYDENENDVAAETIDEKTSMITIVEVHGIRCSAKSFQIDIELKQIMILKPVDLFQKCVIKTKTAHDNTLGNPVKETLEEKEEIITPPIVLKVDLEKKEEIQSKGIKYFEKWEDLLNSGIDAIIVCTPNFAIPEIAIFAMNKGLHVFCEKPPGRNYTDIQKIKDAELSNPIVKLIFGFNHRHHPGITDAKSIIDSGSLGRVLTLRGVYGKGGGYDYHTSWRNDISVSGGGILLDQGIHMLDLFRYFVGDFVEEKH